MKGAINDRSNKPDTGLPEIFANICSAVDLAHKKSADNLESRAIDLNVIDEKGKEGVTFHIGRKSNRRAFKRVIEI